ncbi:MAG: type I DNA topoisomerase [Actinomycetales bacterium]|nr:type I DNA topoisomerase [Actinomycetales bacterium]
MIVESPAKAKKIAGYLGPEFTVLASVGHIRDLASKASELPETDRKKPWAKLAVNVDDRFQPHYVIHENKRATINDLKKALKEADELLLATDEDREGEAIAWHLQEVLRPKIPVHRMVFNEITPEAIAEAVAHPRDLDMQLVDAQETRRIVDRLYGYPVSEVLWKKIGREARSAGRVQSVAVRLVVDRERERIAFRSAGYWDIVGDFVPGNFDARLTAVDSVRVASGRDFDDAGQLKSQGVIVLDESRVTALVAGLADVAFEVRSVVQKPSERSPKAPFMTSTLQQEAASRLRWGSQRTMRIAQSLYENGYITYMRTDSQTLSEQALNAARRQVVELYGQEYLHPQARTYDKKVKNAQEAHEAIRPAGESFRTPGELAGELNTDQFALYDLIWKRTVASQMVNAKVATTTVKLGAKASDGTDAEFTASGTVVVFPGFYAALRDLTEDESDEDRERELPRLAEGDTLRATSLKPDEHRTNPPARFTEASLVKALETLGIGRPSTYASIMSTILDRGYVWKRGSALVPSFTAFSVVRLLEEHFSALIDYQFTANMEEILDLIANGETDRLQQLEAFWRGGEGMAGRFPGVKPLTEDLAAIDARQIATSPINGTDAVLRVGRYGAYVERGEQRANIPATLAPDELDAVKAEELLAMPSGDHELGTDPDTGMQIVAKTGRYGPYVTEVLPEGSPKSAKPRTASLFTDMSPDTITLEEALRLLSLPRIVGVDPETGEEITSQNGRYGPYLLRGKDSRTLGSQHEIFTVTLDQAKALFAQPKQRRGRGQAQAPLREIGNDPTTGKPIVVRDGRFGLYVTDGETNASLRTADDPETISVERASDLLSERRAKIALEGPPTPTTRRTVKARTAPAKKAPAKKAPAKKATKRAAKKSAPEPLATDHAPSEPVAAGSS